MPANRLIPDGPAPTFCGSCEKHSSQYNANCIIEDWVNNGQDTPSKVYRWYMAKLEEQKELKQFHV